MSFSLRAGNECSAHASRVTGGCQDPDVAIGGSSGDAIAAYVCTFDALAKRFDAQSGTWASIPESLDPNTGIAQRTHVAMDPAGNGIVVYDYPVSDILRNHYDATGATWTSSEAVDTSADPTVSDARVAMTDNGDAVAIWVQGTGSQNDAYASHYDASNDTWGTPLPIETESASATGIVQVEMNASGDAAVVFNLMAGAWANVFDASQGTWGTAHFLGDSIGGGSGVTVDIDDAGNAIAAYAKYNLSHFDVYSARYDAGQASWSTSEPRETDDTASAEVPRVAVTPSGDALLVWRQDLGNGFSLYSSWYDATGETWTAPTLVENQSTIAGAPRLGIADNGDAVVAWREDVSATNWVMWVNNWDGATKTWGTEVEQDSTSLGAYKPRVAVHPDGSAVVIWMQQNMAGVAEVWANTYR